MGEENEKGGRGEREEVYGEQEEVYGEQEEVFGEREGGKGGTGEDMGIM